MATLTGCSADGRDDEINELKRENETLKAQTEAHSKSLVGRALSVLALISTRDLDSLGDYVHPSQGVRFSPYAYVDVQNNLQFSAQEIADLSLDQTVYTWGTYDGSGYPIELSFVDYYDRFVYDQDFVNPHIIGINNIVGFGNTLVNISDVYASGAFVEFHLTGIDPQYEGIDWRSLILVFEKLDEEWYLVGIVHNEWTI